MNAARSSLSVYDTLVEAGGQDAAQRVLQALGGRRLPTWPFVVRALRMRSMDQRILTGGERLSSGQLSRRYALSRAAAHRHLSQKTVPVVSRGRHRRG